MNNRKDLPDLIFAEKSAALFVTLFATVLKATKHFKHTKRRDHAILFLGYTRGLSLAQLDGLTKVVGFLSANNAIAPDEMQTALAVINELKMFADENFTLEREKELI